MKDDKLWKVFSEFIRLRDSKNGYGNCCTCGKLIHYKEGHAGHFISRRHKATKFDEQNSHLQCVSCNTFHNGRQYEYSLFVDKKYGPGTADKLLQKSRQTYKMTSKEIDELTKEYKEKVKAVKLYLD